MNTAFLTFPIYAQQLASDPRRTRRGAPVTSLRRRRDRRLAEVIPLPRPAPGESATWATTDEVDTHDTIPTHLGRGHLGKAS